MSTQEDVEHRHRSQRWLVAVVSALVVALAAVVGAWALSARAAAPEPAGTEQAHAQWQTDLRAARAAQAATDRAEAREAARQEAAEKKAARAAARREAARREAAREKAAREKAAREKAAEERAADAASRIPVEPVAPVDTAPAQRELHGEMTVRNFEGALVTQVGGYPGQPLNTMSLRQLNRLQQMLKSLERGRTYPCPGGSGGGYDDIAAGTQVVVSDGTTGAVLATTTLTGGTLGVTGCTFAFDAQVPEAAFYKVEVSHRGQVAFARADLDASGWRVSIRL